MVTARLISKTELMIFCFYLAGYRIIKKRKQVLVCLIFIPKNVSNSMCKTNRNEVTTANSIDVNTFVNMLFCIQLYFIIIHYPVNRISVIFAKVSKVILIAGYYCTLLREQSFEMV